MARARMPSEVRVRDFRVPRCRRELSARQNGLNLREHGKRRRLPGYLKAVAEVLDAIYERELDGRSRREDERRVSQMIDFKFRERELGLRDLDYDTSDRTAVGDRRSVSRPVILGEHRMDLR